MPDAVRKAKKETNIVIEREKNEKKGFSGKNGKVYNSVNSKVIDFHLHSTLEGKALFTSWQRHDPHLQSY